MFRAYGYGAISEALAPFQAFFLYNFIEINCGQHQAGIERNTAAELRRFKYGRYFPPYRCRAKAELICTEGHWLSINTLQLVRDHWNHLQS